MQSISRGDLMAINVLITADELIDRGLWLAVCDMQGLNEWCVNEGLMDSDHQIKLTEDQARDLGLLPKKDEG